MFILVLVKKTGVELWNLKVYNNITYTNFCGDVGAH